MRKKRREKRCKLKFENEEDNRTRRKKIPGQQRVEISKLGQFQIYVIKIYLMFSPQQPTDLRSKQLRKNKKDIISIDKKTSPEAKKLQKKSNKNTPKHSRQKNHHQNKIGKNEKNDALHSQYYIKSNNFQSGYEGNEYYLTGQISNSNKKSRRNQGSTKKNSQIYKKTSCQNEFTQYTDPNELHKQSEGGNNFKSPIIKKIKMLSSKGSINFNGQIVRKSRIGSGQKSSYYHHTYSNIGSPSLEENDQKHKLNSKSKKKKLGSKEKKKTGKQKNKKTKSKEKAESPKHKHQSKKNSVLKEKQQKNPFEAININLEEIHQDIEEQAGKVFQFTLSNQLIKQRGQCLNMIGKICSSMNLKRQTYAIALSYIDSFIDIHTNVKSVKTISIAALMMALKIDHAQMVGQGQSLNSMQSLTTTKTLSMSTEGKSSQKKKKKNAENEENMIDYRKFNLNRPKLPNILTTVLSHEEIFSEYDRILCKEEVMDMEMQMMVKLNFKLTITTYSYWIDAITVLWDKFVSQIDFKQKSKLYFRKKQSFKYFQYLCQLVQISYYFPYAYFYSKVIIVLSIIYLLIRIRMQNTPQKEDKGFENFKIHLQKSTNLVFVDKMGTNQLFGQFLSFLNLDLGDIVNCCQYVSYYFNYKMLRSISYQANKSIPLDQYICMYQYNPEIFRFFQVKCGNEF